MFLASDSYERYVLFFVQRLDLILSINCELGDQRAVLNRVILVHRAPDRNSILVGNDNSLLIKSVPYNHTLMSINPIQCFFNFGLAS